MTLIYKSLHCMLFVVKENSFISSMSKLQGKSEEKKRKIALLLFANVYWPKFVCLVFIFNDSDI